MSHTRTQADKHTHTQTQTHTHTSWWDGAGHAHNLLTYHMQLSQMFPSCSHGNGPGKTRSAAHLSLQAPPCNMRMGHGSPAVNAQFARPIRCSACACKEIWVRLIRTLTTLCLPARSLSPQSRALALSGPACVCQEASSMSNQVVAW